MEHTAELGSAKQHVSYMYTRRNWVQLYNRVKPYSYFGHDDVTARDGHAAGPATVSELCAQRICRVRAGKITPGVPRSRRAGAGFGHARKGPLIRGRHGPTATRSPAR